MRFWFCFDIRLCFCFFTFTHALALNRWKCKVSLYWQFGEHLENTMCTACWGETTRKWLATGTLGSCSCGFPNAPWQNGKCGSQGRGKQWSLDPSHRLELGACWSKQVKWQRSHREPLASMPLHMQEGSERSVLLMYRKRGIPEVLEFSSCNAMGQLANCHLRWGRTSTVPYHSFT